jgi:hypothetical protein
MAAKQTLALIVAALGLSACAADYAYDYDPYFGPRGHYVSHFGPKPQRLACARTVYLGRYDGGLRGPYVTGPYCVGPDGRVIEAPVAEVTVAP